MRSQEIKLTHDLSCAVEALQMVEDVSARAGLEEECPVAFLNLCRGKVKELDWWHWVTIIAMEGDRVTILDSGREFDIDLALWYATTKKRGGFVRVTV